MVTVWISGGGGQLGSAFKDLLPDAVALTRTEFDITDVRRARSLLADAPPGSLLVNTAAWTDVDEAERKPAASRSVNTIAPASLAALSAEFGVGFVTFSTDHVFDGSSPKPYIESDPVSPPNEYGHGKAEGEKLVLDRNPDALVVRTSWVVSGTHRGFVSAVLEKALKGALRVVDDQWGCPTVASDLAAGTLRAIKLGVTGLLHLTNQGITTRYGLAQTAVAMAGLDPDLVSPCSSADYPTLAARPLFSPLASERVDALGLRPLPHWKESLPTVVQQTMRRIRGGE